MMVVEITAGTMLGSMALLADGWHMASHVSALGIAAFAYAYARRHAKNARYLSGTWKVGVLGGFSSALVLGVIAVLIAWESSDGCASCSRSASTNDPGRVHRPRGEPGLRAWMLDVPTTTTITTTVTRTARRTRTTTCARRTCTLPSPTR